MFPLLGIEIGVEYECIDGSINSFSDKSLKLETIVG